MFLSRLLSIWALMHAVHSAPQDLNSRFERKVFQLDESTSTSTESVSGDQEQSRRQKPKFLRLTLLQDLQPPTFGILNKLPYLTLQPPLYALPQLLPDDFLAPLPGPASNSVELEKRSGIYAQENNFSGLEETSTGSNDVQLQTIVSLNNNNAVLVQIETTENLEISNGNSTANLDLSSETPTTEINDITTTVIASRQGKESEGITVNTKIINEIQTTFNDETTNDSSNLILSTQSETNDVKTTSTPELEYSTSDDVNTQQTTSATETINNLSFEQLSSTLEYSSDSLTTVTTEVPTSDQNIERIIEIAINSRLGLSEQKETSAEESTTTSNEGLDIKSTAEDLASDTPTTNGEGLLETTSSATTLQTEIPKSDVPINESNTKPTEVTNINSRYGIYETTITDRLETKSNLSADSLDIVSTEEVNQITVTELDNSRYTTVNIEGTTLAANVETEDGSKFTTTEIQEVSTSQTRLSNRCGIASTNSDGSIDTVTTFKSICEDDYVTDEVVFDEPSDSTQNVELTTVSKEDLQLSSRISETEEATKDRESEQSSEITVAPNLDSSAENPTTTEVLISYERVTETTTEENELTEIVTSLFGELKQNETTAEELVLLTTTISSEEVSTIRVVEDDVASQSDGTTSTTVEASTNHPLIQQELQPRINTVEEVTVTNEKISEELLPPLENIKSNVSVSYGLNYNPNSSDFTYTISTTVKSVLTHKSGEEGNITSEVNAAVNTTSVSQDQNNAPAFSTAVTGSVSSTSQGPKTDAAGFGIEVNKTNDAPEIKVRILPSLASEPNGIHGRRGESTLFATFAPHVFDINKGNRGLGQNSFTVPSNTQFTIKLKKPGTDSNFSVQFNNASETSAHGSAEPNIRHSESIAGNLDGRQGDTQTNSVSFISPSNSPEVGRTINLPTNEAHFGININRNNGPPNLSVQFSSVPNVNVFGRQDAPPGSSSESPFNSGNVRGSLTPNSETRAHTGFDVKEQVNFNSVINIGNNSPRKAKINDAETKLNQANGNSLDKPSKFRSVTIDTSEANKPSELLKSVDKNGLNISSADKYVEAKYVGQTYVSSDSKSGISTVDEKTKNDGFKKQYGFDLSFLNRGINSKPRSTNSGFSNRETPREPPKSETPQNQFNKPLRPRTFGGSSSKKSNTFGISLGPYRDTLIHHTGKGWSLRTYDKLILHTGLSGQFL